MSEREKGLSARESKAKEEPEERDSKRPAQFKAAELYRGLKKSDYLVHMAKLMQKQRLIDRGLSGAELAAQLDK